MRTELYTQIIPYLLDCAGVLALPALPQDTAVNLQAAGRTAFFTISPV